MDDIIFMMYPVILGPREGYGGEADAGSSQQTEQLYEPHRCRTWTLYGAKRNDRLTDPMLMSLRAVKAERAAAIHPLRLHSYQTI